MTRAKKVMSKVVVLVVLVAVAVMMVFPLLWMLSTALKPSYQLMQFPPELIPHPALWSNFKYLFAQYPMLRIFGNSFFLCAMNIIGSLISCTLVAYGFAKYRAPGKNVLFAILLATMMIPWTVTLVPQFAIFKALGLYNTFVPLFLKSFFGNAFLIFLLRQFMMGIPNEMEEAAKIDGANFFQTLYFVILPMLRPALALVAVFTFFWTWNDFIGPLVYLSNPNLETVQLAIKGMQTQHSSPWNYIMAFSFLSVVPCIIVFFIAQRQLVDGIAVNGLKQ